MSEESAMHSRRGRPRKISKKSVSIGRARVSIQTACQRTVYPRTNELLQNPEYSIAVIELATLIAKKMLLLLLQQQMSGRTVINSIVK